MNSRFPIRALTRTYLLAYGAAFVGFGLFIAGCGDARSGGGARSEVVMAVSSDFERRSATAPNGCVECHADIVADWRASHHAQANRPFGTAVDEQALRGANVEGLYRPVASGETMRIEGPGTPEEDSVVGQVGGVIGVDPLIQYLVNYPGGRWQVHEWSYHPDDNEWFNSFGDQGRVPGEWGHWSGQGMNWNSNCAWCHMTDFKKEFDPATNSYDSTWVSQSISCLQCHGQSAEHAAAAHRGETVSANLVETGKAQVMDNCASCHSRREELTLNGFHSGAAYADHFRLALPNAPGLYFEDGQANDEVFVYASFMMSRMGQAGVSCLDCHNPHSGATILPAAQNALCVRCHDAGLDGAPIIKATEHSFHPAGSTGNSCIECHMPHRTYMHRDPRRDHGFTSPDPQMTRLFGVPNACSQCHTDESVEWAEEWADRWYQSDERDAKRERAAILHQAYEGPGFPTEELWRLLETEANDHWRATYLRLLANGPQAEGKDELVRQLMGDGHPLVRGAAVQLQAVLDPTEPTLRELRESDPTRLVRIGAMEATLDGYAQDAAAFAELVVYLDASADRPAGALRLGDLALRRGDIPELTKYARLATQFDRSNALVHSEAAKLLDLAGEVDQALALLTRAPESARTNGEIAYAEGLLWAEKGDREQAARRLLKAVEQNPNRPRWWYNVAIIQAQMDQWQNARISLERALTLSPNDPAFLQFYLSVLDRLGETERAAAIRRQAIGL